MMRGWEDRTAVVHTGYNAVIVNFSVMIGDNRFTFNGLGNNIDNLM